MRTFSKSFLYPNGYKKALCFSYDDGSEHDRRLVGIFNRHKLKATFNLNSCKLGQKHFVTPQEVATLYDGHEISSHSCNHHHLPYLSFEEAIDEIRMDKQSLELVWGQTVTGFCFPFGEYTEAIVDCLTTLGFSHSRWIEQDESFSVPEDFLRWKPTCHHNNAMDVFERYLAHPSDTLSLMLVWGHSYEFDGFMSADPMKNWEYMEEFCLQSSLAEDIWFTTMGDYCRYIQALESFSASGTADIPVWIEDGGGAVRIEASGNRR